MTPPNDLPPELGHKGVRAADRLGITLFVAALLHIAVIVGVGFNMEAPKQISKTWKSPCPRSKAKKRRKKPTF